MPQQRLEWKTPSKRRKFDGKTYTRYSDTPYTKHDVNQVTPMLKEQGYSVRTIKYGGRQLRYDGKRGEYWVYRRYR